MRGWYVNGMIHFISLSQLTLNVGGYICRIYLYPHCTEGEHGVTFLQTIRSLKDMNVIEHIRRRWE